MVFLHFLGGSAGTWNAVMPWLAPQFRCLALDLPGFGGSDAGAGTSVAAMADAVAHAVRSSGCGRWALVGHSMGAKVALVLARRAEDGEAGLAGLSALVLLAGSPPGPEPMSESRRRTMMGWFAGDLATSRKEAIAYIGEAAGSPLPIPLEERAVADVLRAERPAWLAWLESGSREDWADRIGRLRTPALIVSGDQDADLGPAAQARLMAPHVASGRLVELAGAGHLLPLERPDEVATLIAEHLERQRGAPPTIDRAYAALIASDRVSARTRRVLNQRMVPELESGSAATLPDDLRAVLRAALDRVIPQPTGSRIDLAAAIVAELAAGRGDGWRFAALPPDAEAYRAALRTLEAAAHATHGGPYATLAGAEQDGLLERMAAGALPAVERPDAPTLSAVQMALWFADLRDAAVRAYVAHPVTLSRLGFSGIANGGDGPRKQGFVTVGAGEREAWEPVAVAERAS